MYQQLAPLDARAPRKLSWRLLVILTGLALLAGAIMGDAFGVVSGVRSLAFGDATVERAAIPAPAQIESMNVDDKSQLIAEGADAQAQNAAIPLAGLPLEKVGQFSMANAPATYATALRCLTQAVYYEAANEPLQGRRAVAQVVLNRVRHPAYPNSVCGVVYQGSERRTGCQFSFTCDGALLRAPMAGRWREAQDVAKAALAGYVEPSVGTATHYHADYVLPKWAFELGKIEQIGRHIFYRFRGNWGRSLAFTDRYSPNEFIPALNLAALQARLAEAGELPIVPPEEQFVPGLTVTPSVTDRHSEADVGGRIDMTKQWRLSIPDPVTASSRYRQAVGAEDAAPKAPPAKAELAAVEAGKATTVAP